MVVGLEQCGLGEALGQHPAALVDVGGEVQQALRRGERQRRAAEHLLARARCATAGSSAALGASSLEQTGGARRVGVEVLAAEQDLLGAREAAAA